MESSGVPSNWAATSNSPGVNFLSDLSEGRAEAISRQVADHRRPGDVVVVSIHWGPNWGYNVPKDMRRFAHQLIDAGAANIVHGHSSHHPMGIEVGCATHGKTSNSSVDPCAFEPTIDYLSRVRLCVHGIYELYTLRVCAYPFVWCNRSG